MSTSPDPWSVRESDFPDDASVAEKLAFCVRYAVLAPSSHNTQPWYFSIRDDAVDIYADKTRSLPIVDPENRELTISCGAAFETLLIAMGHFGLKYEVEPVVDRDRSPDHHARVCVRGVGERIPNPLFESIPRRHTNRVAYDEAPVAPEIVLALESEPQADNVWLHHAVGLEERFHIAGLVEQADKVQMGDSRFRNELAHWLHQNRSKSRDGMPGYVFGVSDLASTMMPLSVRTFDTGSAQAEKDGWLALHSPLLAVLGTKEDNLQSWFEVGRALARILLRATAEGLSASFLNQPIEVPELRPSLGHLLGQTGYPQLLIRFGKATETRPSPRRLLDEVLSSH